MKTVKNLISEEKKKSSLKKLSQKFKWFLFTELQDLKLTSNYINFICPDENRKSSDQILELRNLIQQSMIREFSPSIQGCKSYDLLVNSIMHRIQKQSLQNDTDNLFHN